MVRSKCQVLTFAMATVCVAGGALAADKAVKAPVTEGVAATKAIQSYGLRQINTVTEVINEPSNLAVVSCTCSGWENGPFSNDSTSDGFASHLGGAIPDGVQAADDFYLNDCSFWNLKSITASVITNSQVGVGTKAKLEIYADCNGCPYGDPIYVLTNFTKTDNNVPYMMNPDYRVVTYKFEINSSNTDPKNRSIYLRGGVYWVSVIGLTDGFGCSMNMPDATYWGDAGPGVKGSVPKYREGSDTTDCDQNYEFSSSCGYPGWRPVDQCSCFTCKDLNFTVCADECPIWVDNGDVAGRIGGAGVAGGSPSQFAEDDNGHVLNSLNNSRTADDFPVPNCCRLCICYIEGCVFTNCPPTVFKGRFQIYGNNCRYPSYTFGGSVLCSGRATKIVDLGFDYSVVVPPPGGGTKLYHAYKLEFHNVTDCCLEGGGQFWIAIGVQYGFTANDKAFFCRNYKCNTSCWIRWNDGKYLAPNAIPVPPSTSPWVGTGYDYSFVIAGRCDAAASSGATGACAADFNKSGAVSVQDLFDFLASYFAGCN